VKIPRTGSGRIPPVIAGSLFGAHVALVANLPYRLAWVDTLCVVLVEVIAILVCFREAEKCSSEPRILWRLLGASILIAVFAAGLQLRSQIVGTAGTDPAREFVVMNTLYGSALLCTVSMRFDPRLLQAFRIISVLLPVAICVFLLVLAVSMTSSGGRSQPGDLLSVDHLFEAIEIFVAVVATSRLLGAEQRDERKFYFAASIFLWANTIIPEINSQML